MFECVTYICFLRPDALLMKRTCLHNNCFCIAIQCKNSYCADTNVCVYIYVCVCNNCYHAPLPCHFNIMCLMNVFLLNVNCCNN